VVPFDESHFKAVGLDDDFFLQPPSCEQNKSISGHNYPK
jgi:hypothetical protein